MIDRDKFIYFQNYGQHKGFYNDENFDDVLNHIYYEDFFEYPDDETCYALDSQYMFGDDIIFAPVVEQGQTKKSVYIPDGEWILTKDKKIYTKSTYEITAEIDEFIAFVKKGSDVIKCFE